jgi:hypothetical protein
MYTAKDIKGQCKKEIYRPSNEFAGRFIGRKSTPCVRCAGQAMIEYVITALMLLSAVTILALLLYTFREHGGRVLDLAASEYP